MLNKVLILSASAGFGHIRAAQAIEKAIVSMNAAAEVRHIDTLDYTNALFRRLYSKAYIQAVNNAPTALGWLYDYLDTPWKNELQRLAFDRLNTGPFVKLLKEYQPDITICTHFLPSEIISHLKTKEKLSARLAVVVTDMDVHAYWLCRRFEHFYVALDETKAHLEALGLPGERVSVTGIPIDPVFAEKKDKVEMRRKFGLDPNRITVLLSTGGMGVGPTEHVFESLLRVRHPIQVAVVCGKNAKLQGKLEKLAAAQRTAVKTHVTGYTTQMDEYMSAADILVGKPGGLTTSEALAKGLVMCIVNPIPGQEERNSDHLLEEGVAIRCNNLPALAFKIDRLLDDSRKFADMQAAARRLGRPDAARDIVRSLLTLPADGGPVKIVTKKQIGGEVKRWKRLMGLGGKIND